MPSQNAKICLPYVVHSRLFPSLLPSSLQPSLHLSSTHKTTPFLQLPFELYFSSCDHHFGTMPRCSGCRRDLEESSFERNRQGNLYRTCSQCLVSDSQVVFSVDFSKNNSNISCWKIRKGREGRELLGETGGKDPWWQERILKVIINISLHFAKFVAKC